MKARLHYDIDGFLDYIDFEGEHCADIKQQMWEEMRKRGITSKENNIWTEEIN
jgi:hypothetical protein